MSSILSSYTPSLTPRGRLELYHGPMFAAKTSRAIFAATLMSENNKVLFINWQGDVRATEGGEAGKFSSHNPSNVHLTERVKVVTTLELGKVDVSDYQVLVVDECHFYPDLYLIVRDWVKVLKKHVLVFGLDGDYQQRPIGQTLDLIPIADWTEKLLAQCQLCMEELRRAGYSGCIDHCPAAFSSTLDDMDSQYRVGGKAVYMAVCGEHAEWMRQLRTDPESHHRPELPVTVPCPPTLAP